MKKEIKPKNYWNNIENCLEASKNCNTRLEFKKRYRMAYKYSCNNKWMDIVCSHMTEILKPKNYWTKERCFEEAKKYNSIKELKKRSPRVHSLCYKNGWKDAFSHMDELGNLFMKVGYKMIFTSKLDNNEYIYIGLTCNFNRRINEHLNRKRDNLYNIIIEKQLIHKESFIYHDYITAEESKKIEIENIRLYKTEGRFIVLNISKGGEGLRGKYELYTKEICKDILKDCNTRKDAIIKNKKAYTKALLKGWLIEIAPHIEVPKYKNGFFMKKENCSEISKQFLTIKEFRDSYPRAYKISYKNNWINEFFENKDYETPKGYWNNIEKCKILTHECKNVYEFQKKYPTAYNISYKNKWLELFFNKNK